MNATKPSSNLKSFIAITVCLIGCSLGVAWWIFYGGKTEPRPLLKPVAAQATPPATHGIKMIAAPQTAAPIALIRHAPAAPSGQWLPVTDTTGKRPVSYVKDELLLNFHRTAPAGEIQNFLQRHHLSAVASHANLAKIGYRKVRLPEGADLKTVLGELRTDKSGAFILASAEPNYLASALSADSVPATDPLLPRQWYVQATEVDPAWPPRQDIAPVTVAVLDSGVDAAHPDLAGQCLPGYNFLADSADATDDNGHGTHVAGIIGAKWNDIGIRGLCPFARILPVKVLDHSGIGTYEQVAEGIIYAADQGARAINLSFGGYAASDMLQSAIAYAAKKQCVLVAAAGNDGVEDPMYPAACQGVIAVGASGRDGKAWPSSNRGTHISAVAPGVDILSTEPGNRYVQRSGTSASAAIISALSARLLAGQPDLQPAQILVMIDQLSSPTTDTTAAKKTTTPQVPLSIYGVSTQYSAFTPTETWLVNLFAGEGAPMHQWIALQAALKIKSAGWVAINSEISNYLTEDENAPVYLDDGDINGNDGNANNFIPSNWNDTLGLSGDAATALIEGTYEEDMDQHLPPGGLEINNDNLLTHYWNVDGGYSATISDNDGTVKLPSAFQEALTAEDGSLNTYDKAIQAYLIGDKATAYYWLGRTVHLLSDVSVPAHVNCDDHVSIQNQGDGYETYTATQNRYRIITETSPFTEIRSDIIGASSPSVPSGYTGNYKKVAMLFFEGATMARKFDSDRVNGSGIVIDGIQYGQGECRGRLPVLSGTNDLLDADCAVIQNQLESRAIGAVATLYILFWNDTHGVSPATVTFDAQSGTAASPASTSVTYGATYGTLATTTRTGYTFAGWWTVAGGTGTEVTAATTVTITAAQTLYAKWTAGTCTVTFDAASGSVTPASQIVTFDAAYGTLPTPTRSGYTFAGWWTGTSGTGTEVTATTTVTITAAQTLYAKWTADTYTVTFDAQGGTAPSPASTSVTYGATYGTLATTTRTGHTFGGWWTGAGGTGTQVTESSSFLITANPILYAQWVAISYIGPDFVITDIAITPELPAAGGHFKATVTVLNPSTQNGRGGHLYAWVDKPAAAAVGERGDKSVSIGTLKAGHSKTVRLSLIAPKSRGTFTLRAFIDARNVTNEDDEGNNQATYVYDTGLPDFEVLEMWLSPAIPVAGKTFTAYVTVTNSGEVAGNGGYIDLWADSSILATPPVPGSKTKGNKYRAVGTLQPGQEKIIRVTGLRAPAGPARTLGVLFDSRAKTLELDETNNWFEFDYGVSDTPPPPPPPPG